MKFVINLILLIGLLALLLSSNIFGQEANPTPNPFERLEILIAPQRPPQVKCSLVIEGLRLCRYDHTRSFKSDENVFLDLTLINMTDSEIVTYDHRIKYNDDPFTSSHSYSLTIIDPVGKKMLTKSEVLLQQVKEGQLPQSELIKELPIYSGPGYTTIQPKQKQKVELGLTRWYDFKLKGRYEISVTLKIPKKAGKDINDLANIQLDPIEFIIE